MGRKFATHFSRFQTQYPLNPVENYGIMVDIGAKINAAVEAVTPLWDLRAQVVWMLIEDFYEQDLRLNIEAVTFSGTSGPWSVTHTIYAKFDVQPKEQ
jgi:hypothetical protein